LTLAGLEVVASLAGAYGGLMFLENLVMDAVEPQRVGGSGKPSSVASS
jgi:hypothetical protein